MKRHKEANKKNLSHRTVIMFILIVMCLGLFGCYSSHALKYNDEFGPLEWYQINQVRVLAPIENISEKYDDYLKCTIEEKGILEYSFISPDLFENYNDNDLKSVIDALKKEADEYAKSNAIKNYSSKVIYVNEKEVLNYSYTDEITWDSPYVCNAFEIPLSATELFQFSYRYKKGTPKDEGFEGMVNVIINSVEVT